MDLWKTTHCSRGGMWTDRVAASIYDTTASILWGQDEDEGDQCSPTSRASRVAKEDQVFQEVYRQTTGVKYSRSRGHGYMSNPKRKQKLLEERMFQERLERLEQQERQMQEMMRKNEAEKEAEREQLKAAIREELMGEVQTMMAPYRQSLTTEVTRT